MLKADIGISEGVGAQSVRPRSSINRDSPWRGFVSFLQRQRNDAIFQLRADLLLIDLARQRERSRKMANVVLCVQRFEPFVFSEIDASLDPQHIVFEMDVDIFSSPRPAPPSPRSGHPRFRKCRYWERSIGPERSSPLLTPAPFFPALRVTAIVPCQPPSMLSDVMSADCDRLGFVALCARQVQGEDPVSAFGLIMGRRSLSGSPIGGIAETQEMLDFCGQHNITADFEVIPIQKVNEAYERLLKSDVKYRFSIDMASLKSE